MPTVNDPNTPKSKWPSGMTFVMYCAGVTMILLAVSLIISGKPFSFSVDGDTVTLHGGLISQGVPEAKAQEKSTELQQQFTSAKSSTPEIAERAPSEIAPFNGTWEGAGSTYELVQDGMSYYFPKPLMASHPLMEWARHKDLGHNSVLRLQSARFLLSL